MIHSYTLSDRQARICRLSAWIFAVAALLNLGALLFSAVTQGQLTCSGQECSFVRSPELLLPEAERAMVAGMPEAQTRLASHVERAPIRLALIGLLLVERLPMICLLVGVAFALRQLGSNTQDPLGSALPWLRRSAAAALVMAVMTPVAVSLTVMVLLLAVGPAWWFGIDVGSFLTNLMLALAAFAVVWALAAGSRAGRDLEEIV